MAKLKGVTHFNRVSGVNGVYVGKTGEEKQIFPLYCLVEDIELADFTDSDKVGTATLTAKLPKGAIPVASKFICTEGFDATTAATIQIGIATDIDRFSADTTGSVKAVGVVGSLAVAADAVKGIANEVTVVVTVTITGTKDFDDLETGAGTVKVYYLASEGV